MNRLNLSLTAIVIGLVSSLTLLPGAVSACPTREGMIDLNCDQKIKIVIAGDSVVAGLRDTVRGGYPTRIRRSFGGSVQMRNLGVSGYTTAQVLGSLRSSRGKRATKGADYIIIDAGRNDCRDKLPSGVSVRNLRATVKLLKRRFRKKEKRPLILVGTQMPNRDDRRTCIEALNRALNAGRSGSLPTYLRFDQLSPSILASDGLHPSSSGYQTIAFFVEDYLAEGGAKRALKTRPDSDGDGVFDIFEKQKFGTDAAVADTDGDGETDGREIFTLKTDPLVANTF